MNARADLLVSAAIEHTLAGLSPEGRRSLNFDLVYRLALDSVLEGRHTPAVAYAFRALVGIDYSPAAVASWLNGESFTLFSAVLGRSTAEGVFSTAHEAREALDALDSELFREGTLDYCVLWIEDGDGARVSRF